MNPSVIETTILVRLLATILGLAFVVEIIHMLFMKFVQPIIIGVVREKVPKISVLKNIFYEIQDLIHYSKFSDEVETEAEKFREEMSEIINKLNKEIDPVKRMKIFQTVSDIENYSFSENYPMSTILVQPAASYNHYQTLRAIVAHLLGFSIAIIVVHSFSFSIINEILKYYINSSVPLWVDYLMTGLIIGGGSGSAHLLIYYIKKWRVPKNLRKDIFNKDDFLVDTILKKTTEKMSMIHDGTTDKWIKITYNGGVDIENLEFIHHRKKDPNMIIYHHTGIINCCTFDDIVRVVKDSRDPRGNWMKTAYHCVVLTDGSIHPFCRWDRYGKHAAGYNRYSLGLAFHGNFETDPHAPNSNINRIFGPIRPSDAQLKSGAQVVVLWTFLYNIKVDFKNSIIPHKEISSKTCPGNSFPYDDFMKYVEYYQRHWEKSPEIRERIEEFKLKPFIYTS